ncbi:beta-1,4-mannosyl-glycoprotein 4-beta-N-acetylglucosaminyltransferase-like [Tigriopus californicus]|uniref:beta-1,4-mannosyl-glycoprotein 4-beta-N-acetylglucosaminyltransferase-like n=1 Tax=Tigriopus californicus TaxID=6832 RepID=UPI0027DA8B6A|nr:beta-1,4-mannosyl-glycoprotein 4-beta-N-acetylglucosaminyltransferase-like [Tigriopus californicus]
MKRREIQFIWVTKLSALLTLFVMVIFLTHYPQDKKDSSLPVYIEPPLNALREPILKNPATAFLGDSSHEQPFHPYILNMAEMGGNQLLGNVTTRIQGMTCFNSGTDFQRSLSTCVCLQGFHGHHCSIPSSIFQNHQSESDRFLLRTHPKRIIMGMVLNHELEMLEVRIRQLHHVVDIFVIQESNITTGGDAKKLVILNAMRRGFLEEFHWKILYVYLDHFPTGFIEDGWKADGYLRQHMSAQSLSRVQGDNGDDLFLSFDADEIPNPEAVDFLRWHDGYPEPFVFNLVWTLYGFYWRMPSSFVTQKALTSIVGGSSIQFLNKFADRDVFKLRSRAYAHQTFYTPQPPLQIGSTSNPGGFHCSWCFSPAGIRVKLLSAQRADRPRWGDFPDKTRISYIHNLVRTGTWFDGSRTAFNHIRFEGQSNFAPPFIMANQKRYQHLLRHPDEWNATEHWHSPFDKSFL